MTREVRQVDRSELELTRRDVMSSSAVAAAGAMGISAAQSGGPSDVISGTVTDENGAVSGATVVAVPHDDALDPLVTTTDANGEYQFTQSDLYSGDNLYHVIARDGTESSPRRGQENYPFIAANGGVALPDSLLHKWPADEGSGSTLTDDERDNDISLTFSTWTTDSIFKGGTAPYFDRVDDEGDATAVQEAERTWAVRVRADSLGTSSPTNRNILAHNFQPQLLYNVTDDVWRYTTTGGGAGVSEAQSTVEGSERILIGRIDANDLTLEVYDGSKTLVGSDTINDHDNSTFDSSAMYVGGDGSGSRLWGGEIDGLLIFNSYLTDAERNDVLGWY